MTMVPPAHNLPEASIKDLSKFAICCTINLDHCNMVM
jgi:hypothetical protein